MENVRSQGAEILMFDAVLLVAWLRHHDHDYPGISIESPPRKKRYFILSMRIAGHARILLSRRITMENSGRGK